ncbi:MAG: type 4a pilus biogenesis protein PilO [Bacteroidota bacterium]|nr:type 4a pilus biogenesis protein PilO [Bacteroidota bacterium]
MQIQNKKWKNYLILTIISFVFILFFDIVPRFYSAISLISNVITEKDKISKEAESEKSEKDLLAENRFLKSEMKNTLSGYDGKGNISSVISMLDSIANLSDVKITSIKPQKTYKKDNLVLQPIEINIMTKYEMAYNYICFLEKASKVVLIKDLNIKSKERCKDSLSVKTGIEVYLNL